MVSLVNRFIVFTSVYEENKEIQFLREEYTTYFECVYQKVN